eukprot:COSAG06_NODE_34790_length_469_cov_0.867568_1_plen_47_part_10
MTENIDCRSAQVPATFLVGALETWLIKQRVPTVKIRKGAKDADLFAP